MNADMEKILLPNDVRKLLNIDNKEIVELCKKTSVSPRKDSKGQIYFSVDEVRRLKNAKSSGVYLRFSTGICVIRAFVLACISVKSEMV